MILHTMHARGTGHRLTPRLAAAVFYGFVMAVLVVGLAFPAYGQLAQNLEDLLGVANGANSETSAEESEPSLEEQLETLVKKLEIAHAHYENALAATEAEAARQFGVDGKEVQERNGLLRSLHQAYQRNISVLGKLRETRESRADLDAQIEAWQGFKDPPPYSIDFADELRDQIYAEEVAMEAARDQLDVLEEHLDGLRERVTRTAVEHKDALRALESADDGTDLRQIQWEADKSRIANLAAQAILDAFEDEALALRESIEYHEVAKGFAEKSSLSLCKTHRSPPRNSRKNWKISRRPWPRPRRNLKGRALEKWRPTKRLRKCARSFARPGKRLPWKVKIHRNVRRR